MYAACSLNHVRIHYWPAAHAFSCATPPPAPRSPAAHIRGPLPIITPVDRLTDTRLLADTSELVEHACASVDFYCVHITDARTCLYAFLFYPRSYFVPILFPLLKKVALRPTGRRQLPDSRTRLPTTINDSCTTAHGTKLQCESTRQVYPISPNQHASPAVGRGTGDSSVYSPYTVAHTRNLAICTVYWV